MRGTLLRTFYLSAIIVLFMSVFYWTIEAEARPSYRRAASERSRRDVQDLERLVAQIVQSNYMNGAAIRPGK